MNKQLLYLECGMGAAGDMLAGALLELLPDPEAFLDEFNALGIPGVRMETEKTQKCGITGTKVHMLIHGQEEVVRDHSHHHHHEHDEHDHHDHDHHDHHHDEHPHHSHDHIHEEQAHSHDDRAHHHHHAGMADIENIVNALPLSDRIRKDVLSVYGLIAEAESHAHDRPVSEIHFHEVGTMDAIADVTAVCMLMDRLAPEKVISSPVSTGQGHVHCAHGILPVPAPATAYILKDVPMRGGPVDGELCTPTGAALLKYYVDEFGSMPAMNVQSTGYGMGTKDFAIANCVRAFAGTEFKESSGSGESFVQTEEGPGALIQLDFNVDDMTGEQIAFAAEAIRDAGAKEVFTTAVGMKKSRPGTVISVVCPVSAREAVLKALFLHTTTIGVRETAIRRHVLDRQLLQEETPFGPVGKKVSRGYGIIREKYEYEDLAAIARREGLSIQQVLDRIAESENGRK